MRLRTPLSIVVIAALQAGALQSQAVQRDPPDTSRRAPRVGVVLSGGGAKGIAHIGVLRVLEAEGIAADVVAGTSMGALVGGLYAIGYTPAILDSLVTSLDWVSYFLDVPDRRFVSLDRRFIGERTIITLPMKDWSVTLPTGVISGQRISDLLARLTWTVQAERDFRRFRRPFVAIGTDVESGETVVLDSGSLARALRASMSIPGLFEPVRVNGRLLIDGGITRNLPARDARALGADILICSDVTDPLLPASELESLVDVLLQTMTIYIEASSDAERRICNVIVRPTAEGLGPADFDAAAEWIARGVTAATAVRSQLRDAVSRLSAPSTARSAVRPPPAPIRRDAVRVAAVVIEGVTGDAERTLRGRLHVPDGAHVTAEELDAAVKRVYTTELFDDVRYRLEARARQGDTALVVTAEVREQDGLGIGVRYDDTYKASLLFSARLRNRIGFGSTTQLDLRLGEQLRLAVDHVNVGIGGSRLAAGTAAAYSRAPVWLYEADRRAAEAGVRVMSVTAFAALLLGDDAAAGVEFKGEHARARVTVAAVDATQRRTFTSGALVVRSNTLDRASFPTRGHLLSLRSEYAVGSEPFAQYVAHGQLALPLTRRVVALGRAAIGASSPEAALPLHYLFMLGGAYPSQLFPETQVSFAGLGPHERVGAAVSRMGAALQWEPRQYVYATLRADVGYAGRRLTLDHDAYTLGVGAALGALTPVGPLELSGSVRPKGGRPRLELNLGYPF